MPKRQTANPGDFVLAEKCWLITDENAGVFNVIAKPPKAHLPFLSFARRQELDQIQKSNMNNYGIDFSGKIFRNNVIEREHNRLREIEPNGFVNYTLGIKITFSAATEALILVNRDFTMKDSHGNEQARTMILVHSKTSKTSSDTQKPRCPLVPIDIAEPSLSKGYT